MTPSHARKGATKYRYYLSSVLLQGQSEQAGSMRRVPAAEIQALVAKSVREHLELADSVDDRSLIDDQVARVEVRPDQLLIELINPKGNNRKSARSRKVLNVPWHKTPSKKRREILVPATIQPQHARPIRSETRATLIASIARGRRWLDELCTKPIENADSIAKREQCSVRQVNMTISLAFLAPDLVRAAIEGRLPRGIGVTRLRDAPAEWSRQHAMLGLTH
jgi:site-specific DNA recombinase